MQIFWKTFLLDRVGVVSQDLGGVDLGARDIG